MGSTVQSSDAAGTATDTFRVYVMVKAMMNIGNGSLADINKYFSLMFPGLRHTGYSCGHNDHKSVDYDAVLTDAAIMALRSIDWVPAGVGWQVWQGRAGLLPVSSALSFSRSIRLRS